MGEDKGKSGDGTLPLSVTSTGQISAPVQPLTRVRSLCFKETVPIPAKLGLRRVFATESWTSHEHSIFLGV